MKCCICGNSFTNEDQELRNIGYDAIDGKVFYRHNKCLLEVDAIFDAPDDESEKALFIFSNEKVNSGEIGE